MPTVITTNTPVFVKDERTESWLRQQNITFSGPSPIRLSDVDRKGSRANQARDTAIVPEAVAGYRQAIRNNQELPAIVVYKRNSKWIIIDGNNRDQAALDEKYDKERAYIVDSETPSEALLLLTVTANTRNGVRVSESWSLHNAVYLIKLGYTRENVAKAMQISISAIAAHEREAEAGERARKLRITGWATMPMRVRQFIGRLRLDKPFVIVSEAAIASGAGYNPDFGDMIGRINKTQNEDEAVEIATQWAHVVLEAAKQSARMGKKGGRTRNERVSLLTGLGKVLNFDMGLFNATFASDNDREIMTSRVHMSIAKLLEMAYRLNGKENAEDFILTTLENLGSNE